VAGAERGGDARPDCAEGVKALILQPIGFLCDHVEILFDVDILFREYAIKNTFGSSARNRSMLP